MPRDVREGGRWTARQRVKNDAIWAATCAALFVTRRFTPSALAAIGRILGYGAYALSAGARRVAMANVERVFPNLTPRERRALVRRCFFTLGGLLGETIALLGDGPQRGPLALAAETRAIIEDARAEGRGVVFASAHLGPWEHVAAALVSAGVPLLAVGRESYDPRFTKLYTRLRQRGGVKTVWRSEPGAAAHILRTLRAGGVLGVPMDLTSRASSCPVPFLGHPAPTPLGPARLALRTRAAVVVGTAASDGRGWFEVTATRISTAGLAGGRPLEIPKEEQGPCQRPHAERDARDASVPAPAPAVELTARINAELSRRILASRDAWVWMHGRWPALDGGDFA